MTASRNYSSTAGRMTLVGAITSAATSIVVNVTTGLPTVPYTLLLDPGSGVEEVVEVTAVGGTTLTVTRGVDGTSAQSHANGAELRHAYSARDFQDSRNHEGTVAAHGATGAVVGTTNTQALTNKTIDYSLNTITNLPAPSAMTVVYAQTSTPVTIGTSDTLVLTAPSITGDGVKVFRIMASWFDANASTTGTYLVVSIREADGTTLLGGTALYGPTAGYSGGTAVAVVTPAAGAHTYKMFAGFGGLAGTLNASSARPINLVVEQIA